ncbi:SusC/RagA family TonB-linked outer membrane protein [Flavobacteriaceae bacterium]|nr:SusC/RagA family TonB-linked outer membrane protein [Flavobacteriaceae bacterium]
MKTTIKSLLLLMLLVPSLALAQSTISGTVSESENGFPLPGVNVIIKGSSSGTTTDFYGKYQLTANNGDVLVFSYVGYTSQEVIFAGQAVLDVKLSEDASALDEIVLIGYGGVKKEDLTGAVDLITAKDFNQGPIVSAQQLISGKIAGVSVTSGSGAPGDGQTIRIRGNGSLGLSSNPLIVLDGIPLNDGGVGGSRNPLNLINPNDIESMVVLKDASATAIYGSRGANGVIIITSKKGKEGDFKFNVNASTTIHTAIDQVDVLSTEEFVGVINSTGDTAYIDLLGASDTNWQDEIYKDAIGKDFSFSALGSAFGVPMRASLGYTDHDGILRTDNFQRTTGSLNFSPSFLKEQLKVEVNLRGSVAKNTFADRSAIGSAVSFDPTQSPYDAGSQYGGYFAWIDAGTGNQSNLAQTNPLALLNLRDDTSQVDRFIANIKVDYTLPFVEGLKATFNLGHDSSMSDGVTLVSDLIPTSDSTFNGSKNTYNQEATNQLLDVYLTYITSFNDAHNLTAVAGHSYQAFEFDNTSYDSEAEEDGNDFEFIDRSKNVLLSYFTRINYDYQGKYLLTATLRADASSKLNPDDRWGYFPSLAAAWNLHKEGFMSDSFFDELKLRAGYGEVGNVNGLGDYRFLTQYVGSQSTANYQFGSSFYQTYRPEPINTELRWEVGRTTNIGLDYAILDGKLRGSVNAYMKETKNLIASSSVDPFTNFGNRIDANIGDMENKGIELSFDYTPIQNENFEWSINYNISFNDNKVTRLPFDQAVGGISGGVGNNIQTHTEGQTPYSFLVYQQVYDASGAAIEGVYIDRNGDDIINDDDRYIKESPFADVIMGFNTNLKYKNWDLSVISRANFGNYAYNNVASNAVFSQAIGNSGGFLRNIHSDYLNTGFMDYTETSLLSDHYVQEASFFKIDNITLGYTLKDAYKDTDIRFYGSAQNVLTVTNYEGLDPEIYGGIDNNFYPRPRSFVFGVNIDF